MSNLILLVAPPGAPDGDISHGTESFPSFLADPNDPNSKWLVRVTREAAVPFIERGGFKMVDDVQAPPPGGKALLEHPDGPTWPDGSVRTFSVRGKTIVPNANGLYEVEPGAVHELQDGHGFIKKLEEKLGAVDAAEAEAKLDAAVRRGDALQVELDAAKKELEQLHADDGLLLRRSKELAAQDKEIAALKAEIDAKEKQITALLNTEQAAEQVAKPDKKK
jgi:hypothetical protein